MKTTLNPPLQARSVAPLMFAYSLACTRSSLPSRSLLTRSRLAWTRVGGNASKGSVVFAPRVVIVVIVAWLLGVEKLTSKEASQIISGALGR